MFRTMLHRLRTLFTLHRPSETSRPSPMEGHSLPWQDTMAAIADLKHMAAETPGAVTIHMALGNLYRAQGDLDQAIHTRYTLLHDPGIGQEHHGRILWELGRDYKRSGLLDRAQRMYERTQDIVGPDSVLLQEMADLAAAGGDHARAAHLFSQVKHPVAQAHHLVQQAKELARCGQRDRSAWLLRKALKISPGSVEAWMTQMIQAYEGGNWKRLTHSFQQGLRAVEPRLRFLLLEGLIQHLFTQRSPQDLFIPILAPETGHALVQVIEVQEPDVHLAYYGAWIHLQLGHPSKARTLLQKCCDMEPDFWPARLELLALYAEEEGLPSHIRNHMESILHLGRQVKKFVCSKCGLKLDQIFFQCPRCRTWHSIAFLRNLEA